MGNVQIHFHINIYVSQLEDALTSERRPTERRVAKLKSRSAPETTEEELSEVGSTRSRPRSRRTIVKLASKPRTRSSTTSSTQTIPTHSEEVKKPEKKKSIPERLRSTVGTTAETETKTPTRSSFLDVTNDDHSTPEPSSPPSESKDIPKKRVTSAVGTSDSDTDFQSAYSASPRDSYARLENGGGNHESDEDAALLLESVPENHEDRFSALPKTRRERVSSTATAVLKREKSEPRTTNPLPSRNRIPSKQM